MIPYLQIENLTKYWGELALFDGISFTIAQGQKVALIARNGAGKSTLMDIITGKEVADSGAVTFTRDITVGYLRQMPDLNPDDTVLGTAFNATGELAGVVREYEIALGNDNQQQLALAIEKMNRLNAWDYELKIKQILTELKITNLSQKISELSGGQKKRVALAHVLIDEPDLLILDEPTNHLDLPSIEELETALQKYSGALIYVSHDNYFRQKIGGHVVQIGAE